MVTAEMGVGGFPQFYISVSVHKINQLPFNDFENVNKMMTELLCKL